MRCCGLWVGGWVGRFSLLFFSAWVGRCMGGWVGGWMDDFSTLMFVLPGSPLSQTVSDPAWEAHPMCHRDILSSLPTPLVLRAPAA